MPQVTGAATADIENMRRMRKDIERREQEVSVKVTKIKERESIVRKGEEKLEGHANRLSQQKIEVAKGKQNLLDEMAEVNKKQEELNERESKLRFLELDLREKLLSLQEQAIKVKERTLEAKAMEVENQQRELFNERETKLRSQELDLREKQLSLQEEGIHLKERTLEAKSLDVEIQKRERAVARREEEAKKRDEIPAGADIDGNKSHNNNHHISPERLADIAEAVQLLLEEHRKVQRRPWYISAILTFRDKVWDCIGSFVANLGAAGIIIAVQNRYG